MPSILTDNKQGEWHPGTVMFGNILTSPGRWHNKKSPLKTAVLRGLSIKRRRLPTLPHCIAVPSA